MFYSCGLLFERTTNISVSSFNSKKEKSLQVHIPYSFEKIFKKNNFRQSVQLIAPTSASTIKTPEAETVMLTVTTMSPVCVSWPN